MQLIGILDSPYVRRAAISLRLLGIPFEHRPLSVFRDFDAFRELNPVVKAPTLVLDDGSQLIDSTLIIDYAESLAGRSLLPADSAARQQALWLTGLALAACEKSVQIVYENELRPTEKRYAPWLERVTSQLHAAYDRLEPYAAAAAPWLVGEAINQADVTVAVAWRFSQLVVADVVPASRYPHLAAFSTLAEHHPDFVALPPV